MWHNYVTLNELNPLVPADLQQCLPACCCLVALECINRAGGGGGFLRGCKYNAFFDVLGGHKVM